MSHKGIVSFIKENEQAFIKKFLRHATNIINASEFADGIYGSYNVKKHMHMKYGPSVGFVVKIDVYNTWKDNLILINFVKGGQHE